MVHEMFPYLRVKNSVEAIAFYTQAFGAVERFRLTEPSGRVGHAELQLGSAVTREIRLRGIAVGSRAMFEDMMRAIAFHRLKPTLQVSKHSFEGAAEVIRSFTKGGHYGKICMRGWSAGAQGVD